MAKIRSFNHVISNSNPHPTEVDAHWCIVQSAGLKLFQISTLGSDGRVSKPKVSQTLQFDKESAILLKNALHEVFPEI